MLSSSTALSAQESPCKSLYQLKRDMKALSDSMCLILGVTQAELRSFPEINISEKITAYYPKENKFFISQEHLKRGDYLSEELMHWIRMSLVEKKKPGYRHLVRAQVNEFFGYLGRIVGERAAVLAGLSLQFGPINEMQINGIEQSRIDKYSKRKEELNKKFIESREGRNNCALSLKHIDALASAETPVEFNAAKITFLQDFKVFKNKITGSGTSVDSEFLFPAYQINEYLENPSKRTFADQFKSLKNNLEETIKYCEKELKHSEDRLKRFDKLIEVVAQRPRIRNHLVGYYSALEFSKKPKFLSRFHTVLRLPEERIFQSFIRRDEDNLPLWKSPILITEKILERLKL
jgi:hypothetical protein